MRDALLMIWGLAACCHRHAETLVLRNGRLLLQPSFDKELLPLSDLISSDGQAVSGLGFSFGFRISGFPILPQPFLFDCV